MKQLSLFFIGCIIAFCSAAQESKKAEQTLVPKEGPFVFTPLKGIKSEGVRGCNACNVSNRLASLLGVKGFTIVKQVDFKYDEKKNTLTVKYLISDLKGTIKPGGTIVSGPFGMPVMDGNTTKCINSGFSCPPPAGRIGKTKYEIVNEMKEDYLRVTFLQDMKVEKGFFGE